MFLPRLKPFQKVQRHRKEEMFCYMLEPKKLNMQTLHYNKQKHRIERMMREPAEVCMVLFSPSTSESVGSTSSLAGQ